MRRMLSVGLVALALLAGCKDQGPKGLDPIVLAHNDQSQYSPVTITWFDQSGQVQQTALAPFETLCTHFTSTLEADSVRFVIVVGDTTGAHGPYSTQSSPWFDPRTGIVSESAPDAYPFGAEYWTMTVTQDGGAIMLAVQNPPCE